MDVHAPSQQVRKCVCVFFWWLLYDPVHKFYIFPTQDYHRYLLTFTFTHTHTQTHTNTHTHTHTHVQFQAHHGIPPICTAPKRTRQFPNHMCGTILPWHLLRQYRAHLHFFQFNLIWTGQMMARLAYDVDMATLRTNSITQRWSFPQKACFVPSTQTTLAPSTVQN